MHLLCLCSFGQFLLKLLFLFFPAGLHRSTHGQCVCVCVCGVCVWCVCGVCVLCVCVCVCVCVFSAGVQLQPPLDIMLVSSGHQGCRVCVMSYQLQYLQHTCLTDLLADSPSSSWTGPTSCQSQECAHILACTPSTDLNRGGR